MREIYERADSPHWQAWIVVGGHRKRISTGVPVHPDTPVARRRAAEVAREREDHENEVLRTRSLVTFQDAVYAFFKHKELAPPSVESYELMFDYIYGALGNLPLVEMKPKLLYELIAWGQDHGLADGRIRHMLKVLSSLLSWSIKHYKRYDDMVVPEVNTVLQLDLSDLKRYKRVPRALTPDELRRLMQAVETEGREIDKDIYKLLVETGMRREELLGMPWREVNLDDGVIRLDPERSKTDQGRFIPLSDTALTILQRRKAGSPDHDHVITYPDGRRMTYPEYFWDRIRKAAKLPGVRIHDLRHTFATMTRVGGLAREDRKAIMGHSSEEAHDLYAAASVDALREVLNRASPLTQLEHRTCTPT